MGATGQVAFKLLPSGKNQARSLRLRTLGLMVQNRPRPSHRVSAGVHYGEGGPPPV